VKGEGKKRRDEQSLDREPLLTLFPSYILLNQFLSLSISYLSNILSAEKSSSSETKGVRGISCQTGDTSWHALVLVEWSERIASTAGSQLVVIQDSTIRVYTSPLLLLPSPQIHCSCPLSVPILALPIPTHLIYQLEAR